MKSSNTKPSYSPDDEPNTQLNAQLQRSLAELERKWKKNEREIARQFRGSKTWSESIADTVRLALTPLHGRFGLIEFGLFVFGMVLIVSWLMGRH